MMPGPRQLAVALTALCLLALAGPAGAAARAPVAHIAQDATPEPPSPIVPFDVGLTGQPGGWRALQWNFLDQQYGIDVEPAWARLALAGRPGGRGIVVAVLDTGVAYANHGRFRQSPDLVGTRFAAGYDFVDDDPYPDDHNGHGTHVASTIAERTNNGIGVTGIAYEATIMPVRVLDSRGEGDAGVIARGVRFATRRGADVINLSLEFPGNVKAREIRPLLRAIKAAHEAGIVIVGASGNEAGKVVTYPARAPQVIATGATTAHGCLSDFSNVGQGLDLVAPGGGADAGLPDDPRCLPSEPPGPDIYQMTFVGRNPAKFGLPSGYDGTSMAAPHVSGVVALLLGGGLLGPDPTPDQVMARLKQTALDLGAPGYDRRYGSGLISANRATDPAIAPTSSG
jgi:serine protease